MANSKIFTIFAGVNGAGKSTLYHTLGDNFGVRLNTDEMVQDAGKNWKDLKAQMAAARELSKLKTQCLENGLPFNQETTIPGTSIIRTIESAKKKNYKIHLYFVNVESVDICKERVNKRVLLGGHGVPEDFINQRYEMVINRILDIIDMCERVQLYDNTFDSLQLVGYKEKNSIVKLIDNCKWLNELENKYELTKNPYFFDL